jgi:glycosyltransferase involved in cell wall biosynthesis
VETDLLKEKLLARGKIIPEKIVVIPPGVETNEFKPNVNTREAREKYGLNGRTVILFVGRIVPYKGVECLVKAADLVVNDFGYKGTLFLFVGPLAEHELDKVQHIDYTNQIFNYIKDRGLESHVRFTGVVPSVELPGLYSACDIFVLPSLTETYGQVISQAMSSQKAVIGTRIPGIIAQIKDGWNGFLVEPTDERQLAEKIKHLIDNPADREEVGLNSRKFVEDNLDWSRTSQMILQLYQNITSSG